MAGERWQLDTIPVFIRGTAGQPARWEMWSEPMPRWRPPRREPAWIQRIKARQRKRVAKEKDRLRKQSAKLLQKRRRQHRQERERIAQERGERNLAILERAKAGVTYQAISREMGLPLSTVYQICQKFGVKAPRPPVLRRDEAMIQRDQQIIERVRAGGSLVITGRAFGISREWVRQICERSGVRSQFRNILGSEQRTERNLTIIDRAKSGISSALISRELGVSLGLIHQVCRQAGVRLPRQRDATKERRNRQIVEQVRAGSSTVAVARAFGLSQTVISRICIRAGVLSKQTAAALRERDRAIVKRVKAGTSIRAVASELGLTDSRIRQVCSRAGIKGPGRRDQPMAQRDRLIIEKIRAGGTLREVARAFGISRGRIWHICDEAGVRSQHPRLRPKGSRIARRLPQER
jgi:DNA invertase Pin-like site-specific DNA recombinase